MPYTTPDEIFSPNGGQQWKLTEFDATIYRTNTTPTNVYWIAAQYLEP